MDWETQPAIVRQGRDYLLQGYELALGWVTSPAAWVQVVLLVVAWGLAVLLARRLAPMLTRVLTPEAGSKTMLSDGRRMLVRLLPLLLPILAYVLTGIGEAVTRSIFDSGAIIAFGKRVFMFLAARILVRDILKDPFLKLLGRVVLIPVAALYALGLLEVISTYLSETVVGVGNIRFSIMALIRGVIAGAVLFWLGGWSNERSREVIEKQQEMRPATRQLAIKAVEIMIFGAAFLLLMNIMGVPLTSLAVIGGAIGVGLGFGLQKIASNFISGVILLLEGQATVGDYVELDDGSAGTIVKTTARAMILETYDGRWIVVPNEDFITTRVINYSDAGSANRYEAPFSVSYDTDINLVPDLIEAAVARLPFVLSEPDGPDCELRGFGESGVDFAVEFWVNGIDDGKNKFTPQVLFAIWNALKDAGIEIPYPQRVVHHKGLPPGAVGDG